MREKLGLATVSIIAIITLALFYQSGPIPQDNTYHSFSDTGTYLSIPNTLNVLSNLPFIFVGLYGLTYLLSPNRSSAFINSNLSGYKLLFAGTAMVGFGSGYYHLWPDNSTLLWDRLPMTIAFMSLYSIILSEYGSEELGRLLLVPLIGLGIFSVLYWWYTEQQGAGDLRYYAVVQFFPIMTIPVILLCYRSKFTLGSAYWILLLTYLLAKLFEHYDSQIHQVLGVVSGHSIKHILPAIGLWYLLRTYRRRTLAERNNSSTSSQDQ